MSHEETVKEWWWKGNDIHIKTTDGKYIILKDARPVPPPKSTVYCDDEGNIVMTETPIPIPVEHPRVQVGENTTCVDCFGCIPKGTLALQTPLGFRHDHCVGEPGKAHRDELRRKGLLTNGLRLRQR